MSYGFVIRDAAGNEVISNSSLGYLFLDQFTMEAATSVTKTYAGMASSEVKVAMMGIDSRSSDASVTVTNSGADKVVSITASRKGWFFVTRE